MKWRVLLLLGLIVAVAFSTVAWGQTAAANAEGDDDDDDDDDDGEEEDKWGEAKIDHDLNVPWDYPSDYISRPLVYNRATTVFGFGFDYNFAEQYYDGNAELVDGKFEISKQTFNFFFGMGLTDKFSFLVKFPFSYKKTTVRDGANNYRPDKDNVYGVLLEEAVVDYFTGGEGWDWWNFQWPWLGDVELQFRYSLYQLLEDNTTSIVLESIVKFPTGNDNMRRGSEARNYITAGNTDWYNGIAIKQQAWKFGFLWQAGYLWRLPADTKYADGEIDMADQFRAYAEVMFQMPEFTIITWPGRTAIWQSFALGAGAKYWLRITDTVIDPTRGDTRTLDDQNGYMLELIPKLIYQLSGSLDLTFDVKIPLAGAKSFLISTRSFYTPPYEVESYDAVGVTYSIGIMKRWQ